MFYRNFGKRLLDLATAPILLAFCLPLLIVLGLILWLVLREGPLFFQWRSGRGGVPFLLVKLKTMRTMNDKEGNPHSDELRLAPLGKFLRKSAIDELPQLVNVIIGDMSMVGPRPLPVSFLPLLTPEQRCRLLVKPGLTGWAQVNGRNSIPNDLKFALDNRYVKEIGLCFDLRILLRTVALVFRA